ncbi:MAG: hypothetical protein QM775_23945 [Pirellulales bacterium]
MKLLIRSDRGSPQQLVHLDLLATAVDRVASVARSPGQFGEAIDGKRIDDEKLLWSTRLAGLRQSHRLLPQREHFFRILNVIRQVDFPSVGIHAFGHLPRLSMGRLR